MFTIFFLINSEFAEAQGFCRCRRGGEFVNNPDVCENVQDLCDGL